MQRTEKMEKKSLKQRIFATKTRKRDDDDNFSPTTEKRSKIASTCEDFAAQEKRIWEINLDEEEDC
jgi:hypothetical protein